MSRIAMREAPKIKFSHNYPKLHGQQTARLLDVEIKDRRAMQQKFIEYDTRYHDDGGLQGYYPLSPGKHLILVFFGDAGIPFTTVRSWTAGKESYYRELIGKLFSVVIKEAA